jgi:hypothetical protein
MIEARWNFHPQIFAYPKHNLRVGKNRGLEGNLATRALSRRFLDTVLFSFFDFLRILRKTGK